ncbi:MAG: hypothetical protein HQL31_09265 [Planctomycetes bacterium]|nr:hypothetical protein [Planctomycetota bacterium]
MGERGELLEILCDLFSEDDFPVLYGLPVGHGESGMSLPLGAIATHAKGSGRLEFKYL